MKDENKDECLQKFNFYLFTLSFIKIGAFFSVYIKDHTGYDLRGASKMIAE